VEDVKRFIDEKQLSIVTVGGHGYGAKIACAFGTQYLDRVSGVMCVEGGPIDHSYHPAWNVTKESIIKAYNIGNSSANLSEASRKLDKEILHKRWNKILKQNLIEGGSGVSWKFNMTQLYYNVQRVFTDISKFNAKFGLFPGRAFVQFASESQYVYIATNTIPFYKFFPKLEGKFPSVCFNMIQTEEGDDNHWLFDYKDQEVRTCLMSRMKNYVKNIDGVHILLADRSEVGWYGVPERYGKIDENVTFASEYTPEHLHHNWKSTNAYSESKKVRKTEPASVGQFAKGFSNPKYW